MVNPLKHMFAKFNFEAVFGTFLLARLVVPLALFAPRTVGILACLCVVVSVAKLIKKLVRP
jgi:hypothetical protein